MPVTRHVYGAANPHTAHSCIPRCAAPRAQKLSYFLPPSARRPSSTGGSGAEGEGRRTRGEGGHRSGGRRDDVEVVGAVRRARIVRPLLPRPPRARSAPWLQPPRGCPRAGERALSHTHKHTFSFTLAILLSHALWPPAGSRRACGCASSPRASPAASSSCSPTPPPAPPHHHNQRPAPRQVPADARAGCVSCKF
jgi:hypothetical protein